ncbi:MAG: metal ABC transporter substrate-binding protein [Lachnospiraceae bacterium]|nr:metal ABC transporter substrate-binding protein [Lachnospiraceae bacterium]
MKNAKMAREKAVFVFLLLSCIALFFLGSTAIYLKSTKSVYSADAEKESFVITASFYPVYIAALNVAGDIDGVEVRNLTQPQTGCLHDYQLTTEDMKAMADSDVLLINGGGIESFVSKVAKTYPKLSIINLSASFAELPEEDEEEEDHDHEDAAHEDADHEDADHDHDHDHGEQNSHFWMDIELYRKEVESMEEGLSKRDPVHADQYKKNAEAYLKKLESLQSEEAELKAALSGKKVVVFHEAFLYLAEDLDMQVTMTMDLDEERQVSAGEVRQVLDALALSDDKIIFAERTYGEEMGDRMTEEASATVIYLDPLTRPKDGQESEQDGYLLAMQENFDKIRTTLLGAEE